MFLGTLELDLLGRSCVSVFDRRMASASRGYNLHPHLLLRTCCAASDPGGTICSPEAEVPRSGHEGFYGFSDGGVFTRWACP
jgi:hypothetical protein